MHELTIPERLEDTDPELADMIKWLCHERPLRAVGPHKKKAWFCSITETSGDLFAILYDRRWWSIAGFAQKVWPVKKVGRNTPCPCGSGKKTKRCCG